MARIPTLGKNIFDLSQHAGQRNNGRRSLLFELLTRQISGVSEIKIENDPKKFQVKLDVHNFKPNEIDVQTVDHTLVVQGKHDSGFIHRKFTRRYPLPAEIEPARLTRTLSKDGRILTVETTSPKPKTKKRVSFKEEAELVTPIPSAAPKKKPKRTSTKNDIVGPVCHVRKDPMDQYFLLPELPV